MVVKPVREAVQSAAPDFLFIVRQASASSLLGTLLVARQAVAEGQRAAVLFTQEALAALARGTFGWPRELGGQAMRWTLADRGADLGLPLLGRGEGRQLDVKGFVGTARAAGVELYACPVWTELLGLEGRLPAGVEALARTGLLSLLQAAKRVVGSL